jgi:hypothetical protein
VNIHPLFSCWLFIFEIRLASRFKLLVSEIFISSIMSAPALIRMNEVKLESFVFLNSLCLMIFIFDSMCVMWVLSVDVLMFGASERWRIGPSSDYHYINRSGCFDVPQLDSRVEFGALKRALAVAGIAPPEQQLMFTLIAALLHLGNTAYFFDAESVDNARLTESGVQNLTWVAYLLQVDATTLMQSVLYRENVINGEIFAVPLSLAQVSRIIHLPTIQILAFTHPYFDSLNVGVLFVELLSCERSGFGRCGCVGSSAVRSPIRLVGASFGRYHQLSAA